MYCIKCGVKLADTESVCPLCNTAVYHPDIERTAADPLYPPKKIPPKSSTSKVLCAVVIFLFLIPLAICFWADFLINNTLNWFWYVLGAMMIIYVAFALPMWFRKPNPVIFTPCTFATIILYLSYINYATGGNWFLSFALPVSVALCVISCTLVTLLYYVRHGKLYIFGGTTMALGVLMPFIEFLIDNTFGIDFIGWSFYPVSVLVLLGGLLIFLGINRSARAVLERKLFF